MKCDYPKCPNQAKESDKNLKPKTAKLCEKHDDELVKLTNENNIPKLTSFMLKIAFS